MDCKDVKANLSVFYDQELPSAERMAITEHLQKCPACKKEYSDLCRTWEALKLAGDVPVPKGFRGRTVSRVRGLAAVRIRRLAWQAGAIAAVFLLVFGIIIYIKGSGESSSVAKRPEQTSIPAVTNTAPEQPRQRMTNVPLPPDKITPRPAQTPDPDKATRTPVIENADTPVIENMELLEHMDLLEDYEVITAMDALDEVSVEDLEGLE